jgi:hypothetical protein
MTQIQPRALTPKTNGIKSRADAHFAAKDRVAKTLSYRPQYAFFSASARSRVPKKEIRSSPAAIPHKRPQIDLN